MNSRIPANILFVSDDEDIQQMVKLILGRDRNDSVKIAANLDELAASIEQQIPDLVILEFTTYISDHQPGFPVFHHIKSIRPLRDIPVLFWMVPNPKWVNPEAQRLGVAGCVRMPAEAQELVKACDVILAGGTYYLDEDMKT